jgi:hypothetical protein
LGWKTCQQLGQATQDNLPSHRSMSWMLINRAQIAISNGLDHHCLCQVRLGSIAGLPLNLSMPEAVFAFIDYSILNFTFFGYGNGTPQKVIKHFQNLLTFGINQISHNIGQDNATLLLVRFIHFLRARGSLISWAYSIPICFKGVAHAFHFWNSPQEQP